MIKDGPQYIKHDGIKYRCESAQYRDGQHKWRFVIQGKDSGIWSQQDIYFLKSKMRVCFTSRDNNTDKTIIEAWIL